MPASDLSTRIWQDFRCGFIATAPPVCVLCGGHVDKTLPGTHRMGPTIDHRIPRSRGGPLLDPNNCGLAHQHCNAARRNDPIGMITSRNW